VSITFSHNSRVSKSISHFSVPRYHRLTLLSNASIVYFSPIIHLSAIYVHLGVDYACLMLVTPTEVGDRIRSILLRDCRNQCCAEQQESRGHNEKVQRLFSRWDYRSAGLLSISDHTVSNKPAEEIWAGCGDDIGDPLDMVGQRSTVSTSVVCVWWSLTSFASTTHGGRCVTYGTYCWNQAEQRSTPCTLGQAADHFGNSNIVVLRSIFGVLAKSEPRTAAVAERIAIFSDDVVVRSRCWVCQLSQSCDTCSLHGS
jgi:hypothetical protein